MPEQERTQACFVTVSHFCIPISPVISMAHSIDSFRSRKELTAKPLINGALVYSTHEINHELNWKRKNGYKASICFYKTAIGLKNEFNQSAEL